MSGGRPGGGDFPPSQLPLQPQARLRKKKKKLNFLNAAAKFFKNLKIMFYKVIFDLAK